MADDSTRPLYHIGGVAALAAVHPQTLRIYEREGLLKPSRSRGKTRLYSERDVERVKLIVHLTRDEGLNLAGVAKILELQDQIREVEVVIQRWMHEWHERMVRELATRNERVDAAPRKGRAIAVPIRRG
ncbi:MAG TPA: MerR family transcriptional regulator [Nitrospiria bacterium]|nr:MerR family transcriptional regulator [Nitrospiria bacterium]